MSLKDPHLAEAYRLMHHRGITQQSLADAVLTRRSYVQRVLAGYERQGRTWQRLRAVLPADIVALLNAVPTPVGARQPRAPSMTPAAVAKRRLRGAGGMGQRSEIRGQKSVSESEDRPALTFPSLREAIAALRDCQRGPANPTARSFLDWKQQHQRSA